MLMRRFCIGIFVAILLIAGFDFSKHFVLMGQLKKIDGLYLKSGQISFDRKGFCVTAETISYQGINLDRLKMRISIFDSSSLTLWGDNLQKDMFASKKVKFNLRMGKIYHIQYFYMRENTLTLWENTFKNHDISGKAHVSNDNVSFTTHGSMVSEANRDLFAITCFGFVDNPFQENRHGEIKFKVTDFQNLFDVISRNKEMGLQSWQGDLLQKAFGDNVIIPIDLKGHKIYLGPFCLHTFQ